MSVDKIKVTENIPSFIQLLNARSLSSQFCKCKRKHTLVKGVGIYLFQDLSNYIRLFFVHFSAGQFRPKAYGVLSFEGEKLSFRSKNTSFFHKGSFFVIF